jgi:hypothetical protein
MLGLINKMITKNIKKTVFISSLFTALFILISSSVYADSQTYAITCRFSSPRNTTTQTATPTSDSQGNVSCGQDASGFTAYVTATGASTSSDADDTVLNVDCGNFQIKSYNAGDAVSKFECQGGQTPTVTVNSNAADDCTASNSQNQALCPHCSDNGDQKGCINPNSDNAVTCTGSSSSQNGQCDLIAKYVNPFIDILSVIFGLVAVISFILGGINFASSEGDPQKSSRAKQRIFNTIVAVVAYMFLFAFLQFLVPGGLFNK